MKARLRFIGPPIFNFSGQRLCRPGALVDRAYERKMWSLCFTASNRLNVTTYEGNLQWLAPPVEQDFGPGVRFQIFGNPDQVIAEGTLLG